MSGTLVCQFEKNPHMLRVFLHVKQAPERYGSALARRLRLLAVIPREQHTDRCKRFADDRKRNGEFDEALTHSLIFDGVGDEILDLDLR
ncbi:hypothetical protein [Paraburkholderia dilworthii]|uniref:hypothetical protein n=1 Tax=Paraburkholderia dilworthii TaxID=948106 RepID=UPI000484B07A|nr:hypothetical protein [Paraburkholderia dilworthii]